MIKALEWIGSALAIVGALMLASNTGINFEGYIVMIVSNVMVCAAVVQKKMWGLLLMFIFYNMVNLWALTNW